MAIFQGKSVAYLCALSNRGAKQAELKSAGEDSNKNVDVVPVRGMQPCGGVAIGWGWVNSFTSPFALPSGK